MSVYIGSVTFNYPLAWVNKPEQVVIGSRRRTMSGNVVTVYKENPSQGAIEAKLLFRWEPYANVAALIAYWRIGGTYSAVLEEGDSVKTVRFAAENGVTAFKHEHFGEEAVHGFIAGTGTDQYDGEINLIIES